MNLHISSIRKLESRDWPQLRDGAQVVGPSMKLGADVFAQRLPNELIDAF